VCGSDASVRLVMPHYQFADLLDMTVGELWHAGRELPQVPARITRMLDDLAGAARPDHRAAVRCWGKLPTAQR